MTKPAGWWDEVPYSKIEQAPFAMEVTARVRFTHPCGFIRLRERHRVKAQRTQVNAQDCRCRISKVKLK